MRPTKTINEDDLLKSADTLRTKSNPLNINLNCQYRAIFKWLAPEEGQPIDSFARGNSELTEASKEYMRSVLFYDINDPEFKKLEHADRQCALYMTERFHTDKKSASTFKSLKNAIGHSGHLRIA